MFSDIRETDVVFKQIESQNSRQASADGQRSGQVIEIVFIETVFVKCVVIQHMAAHFRSLTNHFTLHFILLYFKQTDRQTDTQTVLRTDRRAV